MNVRKRAGQMGEGGVWRPMKGATTPDCGTYASGNKVKDITNSVGMKGTQGASSQLKKIKGTVNP